MNKKWIIAIIAVLVVLVIAVVLIVMVTPERDIDAPPTNETVNDASTEIETDFPEADEPDDVVSIVDEWDDEDTVDNNVVVDDKSDNNQNSDSIDNSSDNEDNSVTTPPSPPVTDFNAGGAYTYEEYIALPAKEQQAYYETFDTPEEFFTWYSAVRDAYETNKKTNELEGGTVDIGDILENMQ